MIIYFITFVIAFCSIVYELLLGQLLSAYLGNTILRYSITIGLYLFSMGLGAFAADYLPKKSPVLQLMLVEICLTIMGGISLFIVQTVDGLHLQLPLVSITAHSLIILIGALTGLEIPLLVRIQETHDSNPENRILGINYLGAFLGTIAFAFVFYPWVGLIATALTIATLNAVAAATLFIFHRMDKETPSVLHRRVLATAIVLAIFAILGILQSNELNEWLVHSHTS